LKKISSQREIYKRLKARVKEYAKAKIMVNIKAKALNEMTDFMDDFLNEYIDIINEINDKRISDEIKKLDIQDKKYKSRKKIIEKKSIDCGFVVDARHRLFRKRLSCYM